MQYVDIWRLPSSKSCLHFSWRLNFMKKVFHTYVQFCLLCVLKEMEMRFHFDTPIHEMQPLNEQGIGMSAENHLAKVWHLGDERLNFQKSKMYNVKQNWEHETENWNMNKRVVSNERITQSPVSSMLVSIKLPQGLMCKGKIYGRNVQIQRKWIRMRKKNIRIIFKSILTKNSIFCIT